MPSACASVDALNRSQLTNLDEPGGGLETSAADFIAKLALANVDQLDVDGVARRISTLRSIQSAVEATLVIVGLQADRLANDHAGAPARDALLGSGHVRGSTARREARRSALAARSAELATWMGSGRLGPDHLDALVRRLTPLSDEQLGSLDLGSILTAGCGLPADTFDVALRRKVERAAGDEPADCDDESPTPDEVAHAASEVTHWFDHRTGMGRILATLDPERYEAVANSIDQHTATLANSRATDGPTTKDANLAAEALVELICGSGQRRGHLPHITVVVDDQTLAGGLHDQTVAETADGHALSTEAISRLCCDAIVRKVTLDQYGAPLAVGRQHRTATNAQWAALRAVYRSCAWHGCDRPLSHCQAHHIKEWIDGGYTDLPNLIPLCSHHHHLVHKGRWQIELRPDRSLQIFRPDGSLHCTTDVPTRRPPPLEPTKTDP